MTKIEWYQNDTEENYKIYNSGKLNYHRNEITYEFNSMDYRCNEFTEDSELPILFMGCSFTEGVGLPMNEVWAHHLHNKIVETSGKKIPFWSLAKGGTSIDYAARKFYELGFKLRPKYVFYLMSGISRREYCYESNEYSNWFPNPTKLHKKSDSFNLVTRIFSDTEFAIYQAYRSAMLLNATAQLSNTTIVIFGLDLDIVPQERKVELFKQFNNIVYVPLPGKEQRSRINTVPEQIKVRPEKARDNSHPGAEWQHSLYNWIWQYIQNKGIDKKLAE